jgi:hypothetical protein
MNNKNNKSINRSQSINLNKQPIKKSTSKIIDQSTNVLNNIMSDKTIPEHYKKNILNFQVKTEQPAVKPKPLQVEQNLSQKVHQPLKLEETVNKTISAILKLKEEFEGFDLSDNIVNKQSFLLKAEIINLKTKLQFYKVKSECYEKIYYTTKNLAEGFGSKDLDLFKTKLGEIFSDNNKLFYDQLSHINMPNENSTCTEKAINKLETTLMSSINVINNELVYKNLVKENFVNIENSILKILKQIISLYFFSEDLNIDFTRRSKFILGNEDKIANLESKKRTTEILNNFKQFVNQQRFNKICEKNKAELSEKVNEIVNFYESLNSVLKTENIKIKSNAEMFTNVIQDKNNSIEKLVDTFLVFAEYPFCKLKELLELVVSKNLKNCEKVIFAFIKTEERNFVELIDKYENLNKQFKLIR